MALNGQSDRTRVCPLLDNSGQSRILARDGLSTNDPKRTTKTFSPSDLNQTAGARVFLYVEYDVQPIKIDPGPCRHCGGELKWKASVGGEISPQTDFYQCETCEHVHTVEERLDYAADRTLE